MADEDATVLDLEVVDDQPGSESTELETELEAEPVGEAEASDEDGEDEAPETWDFDFGGNAMSIPRDQMPEELADRVSRFAKETWRDYTKKSQDVAEKMRVLEAQSSVIQQIQSLEGDALEAFSKGRHLQNEIAELEQVNLNDLWQSDPDQARAVSDALAQRRTDFSTALNEVQHHKAESEKVQQGELARRIDEGRKVVEITAKGFDPDKVMDYVTATYGLTREVAESWPLNPTAAVMAHKAMLYDQMQAKASAKLKPKQAVPVRPARTRAGSSTSSIPSDSDDIEAWTRKRNHQLGKSVRG
jgi:hypothetical protein